MSDESKFCNTCKETKPLVEFGNSSKAKDGKRTQCKQCERDYAIRNTERTNERARERRVENPEKAREKEREWRALNPDKTAAYTRDYRERYPERTRESQQRWRENNPEKAKDAERKTDFNRREHRAEQYAANRDERLAQNQAWKDRSAEKISEYNRAYYQSHKIESAARRAVRDALRRGDLVKSDTCNRCPAPAVIGHHHSYEPEYWLDVEWLCKKCHVRHHAEEGYVNQGRSDG